MPTTDERKFAYFRAGEIRDNVILTSWRNALRTLVNPDTGVTFTEDEIQRATQPGSRFYIEADAIDLWAQVAQSRSLFFVNQARPLRSNTAFLNDFWGKLWLGENSRLPATGGSGTVNATATVGSVFPGSTTIGDPSAAVATDGNGFRYQVLVTVTTPASGIAQLSMEAIDTGFSTNPIANSPLTWSANQPPGADPQATVASDFSGGLDAETDSEYAQRIENRIQNRPAAGNTTHFIFWAQQANAAIETAFVYPTSLHAGSVIVAILQKRNPDALTPEGPDVRIDVSDAIFSDATNYLVPPNSPVVPERAFVVVTKPAGQDSDIVVKIFMPLGSTGGWDDAEPWPNPPTGTAYQEVKILTVTDQQNFTVRTDDDLPGGAASLSGADAPQVMIWNKAESRFEKLDVASISKSGTVATFVLNNPASFTIAVDDRISPYTNQLETIAESFETYFDTLGPGELVDLDTDPRAARAFRHPAPNILYPYRAGSTILTQLLDDLAGIATDAELTSISRNEPDLPGQIIDGPNQVILGHASIFPL